MGSHPDQRKVKRNQHLHSTSSALLQTGFLPSSLQVECTDLSQQGCRDAGKQGFWPACSLVSLMKKSVSNFLEMLPCSSGPLPDIMERQNAKVPISFFPLSHKWLGLSLSYIFLQYHYMKISYICPFGSSSPLHLLHCSI